MNNFAVQTNYQSENISNSMPPKQPENSMAPKQPVKASSNSATVKLLSPTASPYVPTVHSNKENNVNVTKKTNFVWQRYYTSSVLLPPYNRSSK